jgi:hypothetical protein
VTRVGVRPTPFVPASVAWWPVYSGPQTFSDPGHGQVRAMVAASSRGSQQSGMTVRECSQSPSRWASDYAQRVVRISACGQLADLNQPSEPPIAPPPSNPRLPSPASGEVRDRRRTRKPESIAHPVTIPADNAIGHPLPPASADRPAGTAGDMGSSDAYEVNAEVDSRCKDRRKETTQGK